jgi:formamidopyrimidine-DNA glycosylase
LKNKDFHRLTAHIRRILGHAINAGGSTLRDYRDAFGQPGDAVQSHKVYGRAGQPCLRCGTRLEGVRLGGRATVFCPSCQGLGSDLSTKPSG